MVDRSLFVCPIPHSMGLIFAGRGHVISGCLATDLEVDLELTQNYCIELLALYLHRMII